MAKSEPEESEDQTEPKEAESTLKVWQSDQRTVAKVAAHRGITIKELFREKDVKTFFQHLLIEEMRKETERLQGGSGGKPGKK